MKMKLDHDLAMEAKAIVALAFHRKPARGKALRGLQRQAGGLPYLRPRDEVVMKSAVDTLYRLLWQRDHEPAAYNEALAFGRRHTIHWDDPELEKPARRKSRPE